jgi:hypothetical protein
VPTASQAFAFKLAGGRAGFGVALAGEAMARAPAAAVIVTHSAAAPHNFRFPVTSQDYTTFLSAARTEVLCHEHPALAVHLQDVRQGEARPSGMPMKQRRRDCRSSGHHQREHGR